LKLGEDPTRFLSTIQIGITSIGVMSGIVGESALADPMAVWLQRLGMEGSAASLLSTAVVVIVITYLSIVIGELVPKRIGQTYPETLARFAARPIHLLAVATKPFVLLLSGSTQLLLRLFGVREQANSAVTEEEIHAMLEEGTSAGVIESQEHTMLRNVFRLDDRQIGSLMVPRSDVVIVDINLPFQDNLELIESSHHGRFPVVRGGLDDLVGVLDARRFLATLVRDPGLRELKTEDLLQPLFVPETLTGMELLENFRTLNSEMAFIIDEYGEVQGIVTLHDLIEAITGEFTPRDAGSSWAVRRDDGSWLLDGHIPIPELKDRLDLRAVPEEEKGRYHTLSGMIMLLTGRLPSEADKVSWESWSFEIVDMDGRTIDKVLAVPLPPPEAEGSDPAPVSGA
jgi:putative hemolysin